MYKYFYTCQRATIPKKDIQSSAQPKSIQVNIIPPFSFLTLIKQQLASRTVCISITPIQTILQKSIHKIIVSIKQRTCPPAPPPRETALDLNPRVLVRNARAVWRKVFPNMI